MCWGCGGRLSEEENYEEAFNKALTMSDVGVVTWLIQQVDPSKVFSCSPPKLSQALLLSLSQQLGCDLESDTQVRGFSLDTT